MIIRLCLVVIRQAVFIFLHGILPDGIHSCLGDGLQLRLQQIRCLLHGIIIFLGINLVIPGNGGVDLGVIGDVKGIRRDEEEIRDAAAAHGGIAPVGIHIQRTAHQANHGELPLLQLVQGIVGILLRDGHLRADDGFVISEAIRQAFVCPLRHPSFQQHKPVDRFRNGVEPVNQSIAAFLALGNQVGVKHALHILQAFQGGDFLHLLRLPAIGADEPKIKHVLAVGVGLSCGHHVHFRGPQSHKNRRTQGDDGGNGNIPAQGIYN